MANQNYQDTVFDMYHGSAGYPHGTTRSKNFEDAYNQGMRLVFHKASEGVTYHDPDYTKATKQAAQSAGLLWGAYHYGRKEPVDGAQQAEHFLEIVRNNGGVEDSLLALDLEEYKNGEGGSEIMPLKQAKEFIQHIYDVTGRYPIFYCNHRTMMLIAPEGDELLSKCCLWWAELGIDTPILPKGWNDFTFWQHTFTGTIKGFEPQKMDRDYYNATAEDIKTFFDNNKPVKG